MTITARYRSICPHCHQTIQPGNQVEWSKGSPAVHTECANSAGQPTAQPQPARSPRRPRNPGRPSAGRYRGPAAGEITISRKSQSGAYDVGSTVHAGKVPGGGGPDGCYWTVTHAWFARANEDNGQYDDLYNANVRAATEEEVAPIMARITAERVRKACEESLTRQLRSEDVEVVSDTGHLPPAVEIEISVVLGRKTGPSGAVTDGGTTYALTATSVVSHHGGYYDDYRSVTRTIGRTAELASLVRALATNDSEALLVLSDLHASRTH